MQLKGKILRYAHNDTESIGILKENDTMVMPLDVGGDMNDLIVHFDRHSKAFSANNPLIPLSQITLLSPIKRPLQDIICLGINYMEHAKESMRFKKEAFDGKRDEAVYFAKRVNECAPPDSTFHIESKTTQLDYEVELVVIIGKDCKNLPKERAKEVIFGYTIGNDISARDLQAKHKQWYIGKSLEGAFPLGPYIILRDSLEVGNLAIKSYVNGELRQNSNTSQMIFGIDYVIAELSSYFTLKAGSIISMGTPSGVGMGFNPPRFLQNGDVVICEIEGIGRLESRIMS